MWITCAHFLFTVTLFWHFSEPPLPWATFLITNFNPNLLWNAKWIRTKSMLWSLKFLSNKTFHSKKPFKDGVSKRKRYVWYIDVPPTPQSVTYYLNGPIQRLILPTVTFLFRRNSCRCQRLRQSIARTRQIPSWRSLKCTSVYNQTFEWRVYAEEHKVTSLWRLDLQSDGKKTPMNPDIR